jgi:outer membrane protein TolC
MRLDIVEQSKKYNLANAAKAYLPQVALSAKATYQSEVTKIPIDFSQVPIPQLAALEIPVLDKDQYQVVAEANQLIWDGGKTAARKEMLSAGAEADKQQVESELYAIKERVNNVFFGILLMEEQLRRQGELETELQRNYEKVQSYVNNGVANDADLSAVKVEQLKAGQQRIQLESSLKAYRQVLSVLIGKKIDENARLLKPEIGEQATDIAINRPELNLFAARQAQLDQQKKILKTNNMPVIGAFVQGGYGKPGLNMFKKEFTSFFLGGIRFSWNFSNLYTYSNDKKNIELQKIQIDSQRETFLYNLNTQIPLQQNEIDRYRKTMKDDDEIIRLRKIIKDAAEAKVENGTMDVLDMLRELTEFELAKQAKSVHEIQCLMSIYNLKQTIN